MAISAAVAIGAAEAGAGAAALYAGTATAIGMIAAGAAVVGGVATVIGAATGNAQLSKIGGIVGAVGGLGMAGEGIIGAMTAPASSTTGVVDAAAATSTATSGTAAATSDTAAASSASTSVNDALGVGANPSGATSPLQGPGAAAAGVGPDVSPTAGYASSAPNPLTAGMPSGTPSDSLVSGTNGVGDNTVAPQIPEAAPAISPNGAPGGTNGILGSAGSPTVPTQMPGPSLADASNSIGQPAVNTSSPGLWQQFQALPLKDQLAALQVGSGVVGGIANYVAPSPMQKAQIAEANANTAREQQALAMTAQRNANLANPKPFFNQPGLNTNTPNAAPNPMVPALSTSPGNAYSINNNPLANPGLLQASGAPTTGVSQ